MANEKIIPFAQAATLCADLRATGKTVVHCHGTFDMIHPGHIVHFEEARALGDVLVVTITGEEHVNKGPGRPYFNDQLRSRWIAALSPVDLLPHVELIYLLLLGLMTFLVMTEKQFLQFLLNQSLSKD